MKKHQPKHTNSSNKATTCTNNKIAGRIIYSFFFACASLLIASTLILTTPSSSADNNVKRGSAVSVMVDSACTMTGGPNGTTAGDSVYSASVRPGTTTEISGSKLTTVCNDPNGYSIYAIGYSGNSYEAPNNTKMLGAYDNIDTNTSGETSWWAMKLAPVTGVTPPSILNNFDNYHQVPGSFAQIAKYTSSTASTTGSGAQVQTKYQVHVSSDQTAGTYTGKVKYTMIHPNNGNTPMKPITLDAIAADTGNTHYMQESINCAGSTVGTKVALTDNRDNNTYIVAKTADNQCWMIQNLKLGNTLTTEGSSITLNLNNSDTNGNFTLSYDNIPSNGKFHAYTIDGVENQNNSNEFICRSDYDSCYYNWYTATAGAGTTYVTTGNVETSICPAGWTLPTTPQFQAIYAAYPSAAQMEIDNPTTTLGNNTAEKIPGFLLSGFYGTGGAGVLGSGGGYWSRTAGSAQNARDLYLNAASVGPAGNDVKYYGFSVRCLLKQ